MNQVNQNRTSSAPMMDAPAELRSPDVEKRLGYLEALLREAAHEDLLAIERSEQITHEDLLVHVNARAA